MELYTAYRQGRADKDPAEFWYKGEIGFFDFYIIPLAKKLKDCGVFGVSSDEYLNYALKNREEWEQKGEAVTAEMVARARDKESARMERQASMRGPIIAEMKAAVETMRAPPEDTSNMFRQASFRHLRTEPQVAESSGQGSARSFKRMPPNRRNISLSRAVSIGSADSQALKSFRRNHPRGASMRPLKDSLSVSSTNTLRLPDGRIPEPSTSAVIRSPPIQIQQEADAHPPMGVRNAPKIPERKNSAQQLKGDED